VFDNHIDRVGSASTPSVAPWYRRELAYVPGYVKARLHLAEIYTSQDQTGHAAALLLRALSSGEPAVCWRLAEVLIAQVRAAAGAANSNP